MPQRLKQLIGSLILLALVIVYALVATAIAVARLGDSPAWVHLAYFAVTGLLWILPAMWVIKWMLKPPAK